MTGTRISDMTALATLPASGATVPVVKDGVNYGYDLAAAVSILTARVPEDFGAVGDGTTDDAVALQAWLDAGGRLHLPANEYYSSAKLIVRKCVNLSGESYGFDAREATYADMPGSRIRFAAAVGGLDIQPQVSTTNWASTTPTQEGAYNSVIRDIGLIGPDTGAAATGIYCRTMVHLENIWVINFQGKGFDISASLASTDAGEGVGYSEYGNASYSTLRDCHAWSNGSYGFHIRGYDANTILVENCDASSNVGIGFFDESLIGNTYLKTHCIGNGTRDIKAVRTHTNVFVHPYVEGGGTVEISGTNVVVGTDVSGSNTPGGNSPLILAPATVTANKIRFDWNYTIAAPISGVCYAYRHANYGMVVQGEGAAADFAVFNKAGDVAFYVGTGSQNVTFNGTVATQAFSCTTATASGVVTGAGIKSSNGQFLRADGNTAMTSAAAAATTFYAVGTGTYNFIDSANIAANVAFDNSGNVNILGTYRVDGTQVVGNQGALVADAAALTSADAPALTSVDGTNAAAAPTQAEFNALVAEFNKLRTDVGAMRTEFNKLRTDVGVVRTPVNSLLARTRAHGLIAT